MWRRVAVVAVIVLASAGSASAQKTRKVRIDSEPIGAVVYVNSTEEPDVGTTPCTIELAPGTYDLILKLNDHETEYTTLEVPRAGKRDRKKVVAITVPLRKSKALIEVVGAPPRATVRIDDLPKLLIADYPDGLFDVTAGGHSVVVELGDKTLHEQFLEVESGGIGTVTVRGKVTAGGDSGGDGGDGGDGGGGDGGATVVTTEIDKPAKRTGPIFTVGPLIEVGWREFSYEGTTTSSTLPITQSGEPVIGLAIEVNPFRLTGVRALHPLAILFAGGFGVPQAVADDTGTLGTDLETFWQRFAAGLRYRFALSSVDLDLEAGYGGYIYRFSGAGADIDRLPDASYQTVRLGGRLGVRIADGLFVPFVGGENRIVMSAGALADRFRNGSDTQGYAFRGGFEVSLLGRKLSGRAEFNYSVFQWDLTPDPPDYMVTGATDMQYHLSFVVGYTY